MSSAVMTPRRAEQDSYDGSASPTAAAARAAALAVVAPEDKPGHEYLAPTLASLRAQEAHLASLDLFKTKIQAQPASEQLPETEAQAAEVEQPQIIMWESERVAMQMQKRQEDEEKKQEREIVTAVDDWFDLGAMFGCFTCREKS
mmetsp:Transcript_99835/g.122117  ORF Transcript_99835/g.122117 Transcript_99835/m.122117 type:complete len:145 (+) Transcript_99835:52-486(+)